MYWCLWLIYTRRDWFNEWKREKRHECTNMGKLKWLELWWQLYVTWLPVRDIENFRPLDFCWTEGTSLLRMKTWIHIGNPTRCHSVSKFYFIFIWSSTCFGRHTARHQEPKTALAASGFAYVEDCWTCSCWTLTASSNMSNNPPRMQNQRLLVQF